MRSLTNLISANAEIFCLVEGRPLVAMVKDVARTSLENNSIKLPSFDENGSFIWTDIIAFHKMEKSSGLHIVLENGT